MKLLSRTLFCLLVLVGLPARGQNKWIDSLQTTLRTQKESPEKINTLNALSAEFVNLQDEENAAYFAREALALSKKLQDKKGEGQAYIQSAWALSVHAYAQDSLYATALNVAEKALPLYNALGDKKGLAEYYLCAGNIYRMQSNSHEALKKFGDAIALSEEVGDKALTAKAYQLAGLTYYFDLVNYPEALKNFYASLKLSEAAGNYRQTISLHNYIGKIYFNQDNVEEALRNYIAAQTIGEANGYKKGIANACNNKADVYLKQGAYDEALKNYAQAIRLFEQEGMQGDMALACAGIGSIFETKGDQALARAGADSAASFYKQALNEYLRSIALGNASNDKGGLGYYYAFAASAYTKLGTLDSAERYARLSMKLAQELNTADNFEKSYAAQVALDSAKGNYKQALQNYKAYIFFRDSLTNQQSSMKSLMHKMEYEAEKNKAVAQAEKEKREAQQRRTRNLQYSISGFFLLLAVFLLWNNRQKNKAKQKIEKAYGELKTTQAQLIQAEKMASLGELTAGIAHEIQNPLNFVNNFSEINNELVDELQSELRSGNTEEAVALSEDIKENSRKISEHGKRADGIVKGMLQHSRKNTGQKELTNINALADEYLRLSYHGLRAKDKTFNADFKTHFDETIGKINVVPQDLGRVLLNLFNNAFYTVHERLKTSGEGYKPMVSVSTKKLNGKIEICVKDNGMGISKSVQDKIFQPFFTTKPTGQGTGLGLSLSYDIIKAHGGELNVQSTEGEGTAFTIHLPAAS